MKIVKIRKDPSEWTCRFNFAFCQNLVQLKKVLQSFSREGKGREEGGGGAEEKVGVRGQYQRGNG